MSYCILHLSFRTDLGVFLISQIGQHLSFRIELGVFLIFPKGQHLSFRIERSEYEKSQFTCFRIHLHAVRISQSLLRNLFRNDLVVV